MADRPTFRPGWIAWCEVPDRHGKNQKTRPIVIVRQANDAQSDPLVIGVAVTTTIKEPLPGDCIELPWNPMGKCATGFRKRSVAVCSWVIEAPINELKETHYFVPKKIVDQITAALAEIARNVQRDQSR